VAVAHTLLTLLSLAVAAAVAGIDATRTGTPPPRATVTRHAATPRRPRNGPGTTFHYLSLRQYQWQGASLSPALFRD
jgi:hypothetical protein